MSAGTLATRPLDPTLRFFFMALLIGRGQAFAPCGRLFFRLDPLGGLSAMTPHGRSCLPCSSAGGDAGFHACAWQVVVRLALPAGDRA